MLDAFIINRIRKEDELANGKQLPLRIEISQERQRDEMDHRETEQAGERGIADIDFSL
jgi:hypothetical protein